MIGDWYYRNLSKHQNDFYFGQVKEVDSEKKEVFLDPCFNLRGRRRSGGDTMSGVLYLRGQWFPLHIFKGFRQNDFKLVQKLRTDVKHGLIRSCFKEDLW